MLSAGCKRWGCLTPERLLESAVHPRAVEMCLALGRPGFSVRNGEVPHSAASETC